MPPSARKIRRLPKHNTKKHGVDAGALSKSPESGRRSADCKCFWWFKTTKPRGSITLSRSARNSHHCYARGYRRHRRPKLRWTKAALFKCGLTSSVGEYTLTSSSEARLLRQLDPRHNGGSFIGQGLGELRSCGQKTGFGASHPLLLWLLGSTEDTSAFRASHVW